MQIKKGVFRFLCACEVVLFLYIILYGEHGYFAQSALVQATHQIVVHNEVELKNVFMLQALLCNWKSESFFLEKCLRERLDLMYPHDELYFF